MTNWMTAAGLAFIAGGLATLISFRAVLFGAGRRTRRAGSSARRRETVRPSPNPRPVEKHPEKRPEQPVKAEVAVPARRVVASVRPVSGLAMIGLADEEADDEDEPEPEREREREEAVVDNRPDRDEDDPWPPRRRRREPEPDGRAWARRDAESPRGYAGRFAGQDEPRETPDWDWPRRPEPDERPPAGDYWTPVPDDLYTASVLDPLPPVPDYEPATGFDLPPIPATGPMPEWPPRRRRVQLPRSWADREEPGKRAAPYVSRHSVEGH